MKITINERKYTGDSLEITIDCEDWRGEVVMSLTPNEAHQLMEKLATELGMSIFRSSRGF